MSLYTQRLTREQAQSRLDAALGKMPRSFESIVRESINLDKPIEEAIWLRRHAHVHGCPDAACDAFFAVLGYHNTLVAESIAAEEREAHEAEEKARVSEMAEHWREWAMRERPPERIDDVTAG